MAGNEMKVDFTGLDGVQQGLVNTGTSVVTNVTHARPAVTSGSDAHPGWQTSAVNQLLFDSHGDVLYHWVGHVNGLANGVHSAGAVYSSNETQTTRDLATILNQES